MHGGRDARVARGHGLIFACALHARMDAVDGWMDGWMDGRFSLVMLLQAEGK